MATDNDTTKLGWLRPICQGFWHLRSCENTKNKDIMNSIDPKIILLVMDYLWPTLKFVTINGHQQFYNKSETYALVKHILDIIENASISTSD